MASCLLGQGIYSYSEAARLTGLHAQRVRAWFEGWPRGLAPAMATDLSAESRASGNISFLDLIDVLVAGNLRHWGLSLQYLRRAYTALAADLNTTHPFARHELFTDGTHLFRRTADPQDEVELLDVVERQHAFDDILRPYLQRIEWDRTTNLAARWEVDPGILLDPTRHYGKPILRESAMPTDSLAAAYNANGCDEQLVADWYDVSPSEVLQAVSFEREHSGKAA